MRRVFSVVVIASGLTLQGCMLATQQDLMRLDDDLTHLRKSQADMVTKMTDLSGNLEALNSQLESSQQRMSSLSQKLDDLQSDLARRFNVLSGQVTGTTTQGASSPGDLFRIAYNDYQGGKFDLALVGFRNFLTQNGRTELAPQAQFYLGECEFGRRNFVDAAREYARVVEQWPKSDFAPKALYKRAVSLQQINKRAEAREALNHLFKEYPRSEVTKSARDLLKDLQ